MTARSGASLADTPRAPSRHRKGALWERLSERTLQVSETFVSIQGEGCRAGWPSAFVRLTGCGLRCRWCDTTYAYSGGRKQSLRSLESWVVSTGLSRVCLTGGEPLLQPDLLLLAERLVTEHAYDVVLETGGDQDVSAVAREVSIVLDIKLPASKMTDRMRWTNLDQLGAGDELKLVVADRNDYEMARELLRERLKSFPGEILLSPVHGELAADTLAQWVLSDRLEARVQIQLHRLLWPSKTRGA